MRSAAIMQPYFLPYLGYYQLAAATDVFVIYDTVQYTKKGWINRNRILKNGEAAIFSLPIRKASDYLDISEREVSEVYDPAKFCAQIAGVYAKAPQFSKVRTIIEEIAHFDDRNLFAFLAHSIRLTCDYLGISTPIHVASEVEVGKSELRNADRVINICQRVKADRYINPPGGRDLYEKKDFFANGIDLKFLEPELNPYPQFGAEFVPGLSILDVMMFNSVEKIQTMVRREYTLAP